MANLVYNAIVFTDNLSIGNRGYITYHKINSLEKFQKFLNQKYPLWKFATLYNNATKEKIGLIKP